jgi:hypothetical protein
VAKRKEAINPFYPLLVAFGVVFFVTACAYGVMAFRAVGAAPGAETEHVMLVFLNRHGLLLLGAELALLAAASLAAMGTDSYWTRRNSAHRPHSLPPDATNDERGIPGPDP